MAANKGRQRTAIAVIVLRGLWFAWFQLRCELWVASSAWCHVSNSCVSYIILLPGVPTPGPHRWPTPPLWGILLMAPSSAFADSTLLRLMFWSWWLPMSCKEPTPCDKRIWHVISLAIWISPHLDKKWSTSILPKQLAVGHANTMQRHAKAMKWKCHKMPHASTSIETSRCLQHRTYWDIILYIIYFFRCICYMFDLHVQDYILTKVRVRCCEGILLLALRPVQGGVAPARFVFTTSNLTAYEDQCSSKWVVSSYPCVAFRHAFCIVLLSIG